MNSSSPCNAKFPWSLVIPLYGGFIISYKCISNYCCVCTPPPQIHHEHEPSTTQSIVTHDYQLIYLPRGSGSSAGSQPAPMASGRRGGGAVVDLEDLGDMSR